MALCNNIRSIVLRRPIQTPIRTESSYSYENAKIYKKTERVKCNAFFSTQKQPAIRFRKGNNMSTRHTSLPLEGLCIYPRSYPDTAMRQLLAERIDNGYITPLSRYPGYQGMAKKLIGSYIGHWRWYAQTREPDRSAPKKEAPFKGAESGLGKTNPAKPSAISKPTLSRLEQIKRMLKDKAMLRGTENTGKKAK